MNGPEHYREAERLLGMGNTQVAEAQVHATLALAAATVDAHRGGLGTWEQYPGPEVTR